jgi:hypothetical protein
MCIRTLLGLVLLGVVAAFGLPATAAASGAHGVPRSQFESAPVQVTEVDTVVTVGDVKLASGITIERVPGGTVTRRAGSATPEWFTPEGSDDSNPGFSPGNAR